MSGFTIDLPKPPSANRIWRNYRGKTVISERYKTWKRVADNILLAHRRSRSNLLPVCKVEGPFQAIITISRETRRQNEDIDNRSKAILDWLQRVELIDDDSLCESLLIRWGDAPDGCMVQIAPCSVMREAA